jgi:hypothetical protein
MTLSPTTIVIYHRLQAFRALHVPKRQEEWDALNVRFNIYCEKI